MFALCDVNAFYASCETVFLFWRFVGLVFLLLYVAQPLLIIFQIAVERFDFTIVNQVEIVSGGTQQMTVVRNDNQRAFKLD